MDQGKKTVKVTVSGTEYEVPAGTLLSTLPGAPLPCGGHGKCGKCKVRVSGNVSPVSATEREKLTNEELQNGIRLACRAKATGNCSAEFLTAQSGKNKILTDALSTEGNLAPAFQRYGAAVDIGTTTLAAQLYDSQGRLLATRGRMNPQSVWGADVISRIEAALKGNGAALAASVCGAIDDLLRGLAADAKIAPEAIDGLVLTGNTAMLHLCTKTSPEPLSRAPFQAKRLFGETVRRDDLGLHNASPEAEIYFPPCIAAFVGADTVCALLATRLCASPRTALLADIGTNGEMGLWHDQKLTVCSTAAGPAFEGVGISTGMSGAPGAVDRVTVSDGRLSAHVIGEEEPRGICGSGLIDAVACLLETGELDETGFLEDAPALIAPPVSLTQSDIRMVQLAKSAVCAGINTLLHEAGIGTDQVTVFEIAGGFGSYLNVKNAGKIGLFPAALVDKVHVAGNAALAGAAMLLLDKTLRPRAAQLAKNTVAVDLATNPVFINAYTAGMLFE